MERTVTLKRLSALRRHWLQHPRAEWLMAARMKYKPPTEKRVATNSDFSSLLKRFGATPGTKRSLA